MCHIFPFAPVQWNWITKFICLLDDNFQLFNAIFLFNKQVEQKHRTRLSHSPFTILLFLLKNKPYVFFNWDIMRCTTITTIKQKPAVTMKIVLYHSPFCSNIFLDNFKNSNHSHLKKYKHFHFHVSQKKNLTVVTIVRI